VSADRWKVPHGQIYEAESLDSKPYIFKRRGEWWARVNGDECGPFPTREDAIDFADNTMSV